VVAGAAIEEGPYALLEVCDSGAGMDASTLSRIFDPFFTTRFQGRGLGLPTVLGVVRAHRGALAVQSAPGQGTCFSVLLPSAHGLALSRERFAQPALRLRGWVMVVDDEPEVGQVTVDLLQSRGARADLITSGEALLARLDGGAQPDLVLLDRLMPGLGGDETLRRLRERWPALAVVIYSGHEAPMALVKGDPHTEFLAKPSSQAGLIRALGALHVSAAGPIITS
jgi:two-component system, cell cycle sensor histidine kinase and response regulator CckA